jgi:hypothetical protein
MCCVYLDWRVQMVEFAEAVGQDDPSFCDELNGVLGVPVNAVQQLLGAKMGM